MSVGCKLADSLNLMYKDVVNKGVTAPINTREYIETEKFMKAHYPELNDKVLEFLAMYMCVHKKGTICFHPAEKESVDLLCQYDDVSRVIGFNYIGCIVKDEVYKGIEQES